ncbi:class II fructose-bisphosphate aldolase [Thermovenabulum gondwanense]|uniref:D-tagatose-1,6-bisphosphate aldolase subunit GatY n=1 Tax=Thermovenabulum gondwanense TaxID=520767 RepID=A0A162MQ02_9FIRM|nr:class II fructose-bisphosphate aldolase [Thermovenabulum gondwanense]KYO66912.1 D-tagatose-1,6-bisphosphate aldolase subunit GatY [Thermovenabulum gondwanense]
MKYSLSSILNKAKKRKYAIGAFNVYNYETIKGVIESAVELKIPAIVAFGERYLENMDFNTVSGIVNTISEDVEVPIVLHLDHCKSFENIVRAIKAGFCSVMFDGSSLPLEENIKRTKEVVKIAHAAGVSVEAELGSLSSGDFSNEENSDEIYTNPEEAKIFVKETNVDALAVSIGTVHGLYKGEPKINIDILKKIASLVDIPLVLHGGSGTPEVTLKECIKNGICKINVNTEISVYTVERLRNILSEKNYHLSRISLLEVNFVKDVVKKYMKIFYSV